MSQEKSESLKPGPIISSNVTPSGTRRKFPNNLNVVMGMDKNDIFLAEAG